MSGLHDGPTRVARLALLACVAAAASCGDTPTKLDDDPDPVRRIATVHAGAHQSAFPGQTVPVAPAVRVTDGQGEGVSGVSVAFVVTGGGGTVSGATRTTGADGVATVEGWTLGVLGVNTLEARVTGATSGSPVVFAAIGLELVLQPSADTVWTGVVSGTRLIVPKGVTVTVVDSLVVRADSAVEIRGTIAGDCVPMRLDTQGELTIRGTIDNSCDTGDTNAGLDLVGRAGFSVDSATIRSSGDVRVTNDPTLSDADALPTAGSAPAAASASQVATRACRLLSATLEPYPSRAANGVSRSGVASPGADGRTWRVDCRGTLRVLGGVTYAGQDGGDGGTGMHSPGGIDAYAEGGAGGRGGRMVVRASEKAVFSGILNEIRSGNGGRGGDAEATSSQGSGATAPTAEAVGGAGGEPGLLAILAPSIDVQEPLDLVVGRAGDGGDATAVSADGREANGPVFAQAGGPTFATGGLGGGTPELMLAARGGAQVTGRSNILVSGGDAGNGGAAEATAGAGGRGWELRPDGGAGGMIQAVGGSGGSALLLNHDGVRFGDGGNGGEVGLAGAQGGEGDSQCSLPLGFQAGGVGGEGGALMATHGAAGDGAAPGIDGDIRLHSGVARGGDGGNGEPLAAAGPGGAQTLSKPAQADGANSQSGRDGFECVRPNIVSHRSVTNGALNPEPCNAQAGAFSLVSFSLDPVDYSISVDGIGSFAVQPDTGFIPGAIAVPWATVPVQMFADKCTMAQSGPLSQGQLTVTFTLGPTSVTKTVDVRYEFR